MTCFQHIRKLFLSLFFLILLYAMVGCDNSFFSGTEQGETNNENVQTEKLSYDPLDHNFTENLDYLDKNCWYVLLEKNTKWKCWVKIDTGGITSETVTSDENDTKEAAVIDAIIKLQKIID